MKHMRTEEEIREYNKRIEEIFRKHNLIPKKVDVEENNDFIVIFQVSEKSTTTKTRSKNMKENTCKTVILKIPVSYSTNREYRKLIKELQKLDYRIYHGLGRIEDEDHTVTILIDNIE